MRWWKLPKAHPLEDSMCQQDRYNNSVFSGSSLLLLWVLWRCHRNKSSLLNYLLGSAQVVCLQGLSSAIENYITVLHYSLRVGKIENWKVKTRKKLISRIFPWNHNSQCGKCFWVQFSSNFCETNLSDWVDFTKYFPGGSKIVAVSTLKISREVKSIYSMILISRDFVKKSWEQLSAISTWQIFREML